MGDDEDVANVDVLGVDGAGDDAEAEAVTGTGGLLPLELFEAICSAFKTLMIVALLEPGYRSMTL